MKRNIILPTNNLAFQICKVLKAIQKLVTCLMLPWLLNGCSLLGAGLVTEDIVAYPMRSPEYVLRDLGSNRYLLAQWDVPMNANEVQRIRYYDRNTGMLSHLPDTVVVFRKNYVTNILGALRYESDSPLQIVFLTNRDTQFDQFCAFPEGRDINAPLLPFCGNMDIVLSLDGGYSFGWRRIHIPSSIGKSCVNVNHYEFAIVRNNMLYLGMYVHSLALPEKCYIADNGNLETLNRITYARHFTGKATIDQDDIFLAVLAMPLPDSGGKPLPAAQIPEKLTADLLTGHALQEFDLGKPMALIETQPTAEPKSPVAQYKRSDRASYIESLRMNYPEWAAHQTLDDIPKHEQWMSRQDVHTLMAKQRRLRDDPIEWIRFEPATPK